MKTSQNKFAFLEKELIKIKKQDYMMMCMCWLKKKNLI
jgi:hypothetical protein